MNFFSVFSSAWNSLTEGATGNSFAPIVNIDGTPMANDSIDIHGNPFGVTNSSMHDCAHDWGAGADMGMPGSSDPWSNGSGGSGGFGDGF